MERLFSIEESRVIDLQGTKALHRAGDGKLYVGPAIEAGGRYKICADVSAHPEPDGYYRIYRVLRIIPADGRLP